MFIRGDDVVEHFNDHNNTLQRQHLIFMQLNKNYEPVKHGQQQQKKLKKREEKQTGNVCYTLAGTKI